ncbi:MAG: TonB-dependent receptor [Acidobacteria bacterium]|nr:TonB-dependent receptor [Acidobacteriota bacterium]
MSTPHRLVVPALMAALTMVGPADATAQSRVAEAAARVTQLAAATTGSIGGVVLDDRGQPLDGVVVSALGGSTAFAVTDRAGQFSLRSLSPGPYLVRAHLSGYLPARTTIVDVRPSSRTSSSFTLRRSGADDEPRVVEAGVGGTGGAAVPSPVDAGADGRDESETAWRLRHLRRPILRDAVARAEFPPDDDDWFVTDSMQFVGRAVESSARLASSLFTADALEGQVNLLTTGAFDDPSQLLQLDRTKSVAFFSVGAPVGGHGDWVVRAALNQGDLSSWILAGNYVVRAPATHRYTAGMSYGLQRYEGGNALALAAVPDAARNVGSVFAFDQWALSPRLTVEYGANYAHYDYLQGPGLFSPQLGATVSLTPKTRIRALTTRQLSAPGREEFLPPSRAEFVPPQRTFSPLTAAGFRTESVQHYEVAVERSMQQATIQVRAFHQRVDDQMTTLFGVRSDDSPPATLGHYFLASAGDVTLRGLGVTLSHEFAEHLRGAIDYSLGAAEWTDTPPVADLAALRTLMPSAVGRGSERVHDLTTWLETQVPRTATRVFVLYRVSNAFIDSTGASPNPALDGRFDLQLSQRLPFRNFLHAEWEALVAVRNVYRETALHASPYDELLVARPPKLLVGGLTVKF